MRTREERVAIQPDDDVRHESLAVVIPARLEGNRIDRCLDGLSAQDIDRPLEVLVVCNGPVDGTETRVAARRDEFRRRGWSLDVEVLDEHGKCASIRHAARLATPGPLVVLDVRVGLRSDTLRRLVSGATEQGLAYASARLDYRVAGDAVVRAYGRAYASSPFGRSADLHGGCIYVAADRRADLCELPDVLAEDRYYLSLTSRSRRGAIADAVVDYHFPPTARQLFRQQVRWIAGNRAAEPEMGRYDRPDHETDRRPYFGQRPPRRRDRVVYLAVVAGARAVARARPRRGGAW